MDEKILRYELLGAPSLTINTIYEICESTPGFLFQCTMDVPTRSANGDALTQILVHLKTLGAPQPNKISRQKCTSTVAFLLR